MPLSLSLLISLSFLPIDLSVVPLDFSFSLDLSFPLHLLDLSLSFYLSQCFTCLPRRSLAALENSDRDLQGMFMENAEVMIPPSLSAMAPRTVFLINIKMALPASRGPGRALGGPGSPRSSYVAPPAAFQSKRGSSFVEHCLTFFSF